MLAQSEGVLLFHPGCGPFVQQVGRALHEGHLLTGLKTTINYQPDSPKWTTARQLANLLGLKLDRLLANRRVSEIPHDLVDTNGWREILRAGASRFDRDGRLTDGLWEWSELAFDRWVSKGVTSELSAVYGYEHAALSTFRRAKNLGVPCVYELPAPEPEYVNGILAREYERFPELDNPYGRHLNRHLQRRTLRRRAEGKLADLVICNSRLTRDSYVAAGMDPSRIRVIPLGAPPLAAQPGRRQDAGHLRVIWAGTFSIRKGAHHLISAWRQYDLGRESIRLDVYGTPTLPQRLLADLPANIRFHGPCPQTELFSHFLEADLLVLPTLCDGFGMVITEAMAHGLPVLTTSQAGAADLLSDGENGMVIKAGDIESLAAGLDRAIVDRSALHSMGLRGREVAAKWQWADFRATLLKEVQDFLDSGRMA